MSYTNFVIKNFMELSRNKRSDMVISLKNTLRRNRVKGVNYNFVPFRIDKDNQWINAFALSKKDKFIRYFCDIQTCQCNLISIVREKAWKETNELIKEVRNSNEFTFQHNHFIVNTYKELNDMTIVEYYEYLAKDLIKRKPKVYEKFVTDINNNTCADGVHLEIVVNEKYLTPEIVDNCLNKFYELGEVDWISCDSVSEDNLVYELDV